MNAVAGRHIPGVLERIDPETERLPVVFDSPHSGHHYPDDFGHRLPRVELRYTEDAFIDDLYSAAPEQGATLLRAIFPRAYVDPNRAPDDIDNSILERPWPGANPGPKSALGVGVIPSREPGGIVYDRKLTHEEVRRRFDNFYWAYHRELEQVLDRAHELAGAVWHLNCHSMPSLSSNVSPEGPGVRRPDFVLGDRDGTTANGDFTQCVARSLSEMGYHVAINDPFKGVELVRRYSDPGRRRHSLQVEVNRALYMNERRMEPHSGYEVLKCDLSRLVKTVCAYARENL